MMTTKEEIDAAIHNLTRFIIYHEMEEVKADQPRAIEELSLLEDRIAELEKQLAEKSARCMRFVAEFEKADAREIELERQREKLEKQLAESYAPCRECGDAPMMMTQNELLYPMCARCDWQQSDTKPQGYATLAEARTAWNNAQKREK